MDLAVTRYRWFWRTAQCAGYAMAMAALCLAAAPGSGFDETVKPFLAKNCYGCHNTKLHTADLDVQKYSDVAGVAADHATWQKIQQKIVSGEMPPKGIPRPPQDDVNAVAKWIEGEFAREDALIRPDPGHVTAHRLNRAEYNNTIRDLLGVDFHPADDFPQDDSGYGFDNVSDVLSLSPVLMEKYLVAAEQIAHAALFGPPAMKPVLERYQPPYRDFPLSRTPQFDYDKTGLSMPNSLHWEHRIPVSGEYLVRIVPEGRRPLGSEPVTLAFWIDGKMVQTVSVDAPSDGGSQDLFGQAREFRINIPAGDHWLAGSVLNLFEGLPVSYHGPNPSHRPEPPPRDFSKFLKIPPDATPEQAALIKKRFEERIANQQPPANRVYIHYVEIVGPYNAATGPSQESLKKIRVCSEKTTACETKIITNLARRAFRRPVSQADVAPYLKIDALARRQGGSFEDGLSAALEAILVSPDFLFRVEREHPAKIASTKGVPPATGIQPLDDYELASRLSYFLWSSMPDDELMRAANQGSLHKPEVIEAQVRRMLRDPRSNALVTNFAGQWLELRRLESVTPDRDKFPEFENYLRMSMRKETELFFRSIMDEDRSILDLLDAKYTFLNQRLAEFYGIKDVKGPEWRRVDLAGTKRGGILTQASVLTVSSYATRTSPVLRGKWVLENLLNAPPPPPPPNVPALAEAKAGTAASLRQVMEEHRSNPVCASCHSKMDPIGFGLENFNAIGEWRDKDGNFPVDASGVLPDGRKFNGPTELEAILRQNKDAFAECVAEKMLIYALGRGVERYDRPALKQITARMAADDYRFSSLVTGIVESMPFQMTKGSEAPQPAAAPKLAAKSVAGESGVRKGALRGGKDRT